MKRIEEFGIRLTKIVLISLFLCAVLPSAQAAKGGGGKVSVTDAAPSEAFQDVELDVTISGSGFDDGSTASFLVTGTADDSQIEILSNEYLPSTDQLKTRIKVKGGASAVYYDIEVTNSRGRRGKGSTMFKVKQDDDVCSDTEFPTFARAIATASSSKGRGRIKEPGTSDIILTGNNGCTSYVLVSAYPYTSGITFNDLKFTLKNGLGVVTWLEKTEMDEYGVSIHRIMGVFFDVLPGSVISPAQPQAEELYQVLHGAGENIYIRRHNIILDNELKLHIAFTYIHPGTGGETGVQVLDVDSGVSQVLLSGQYHFLDAQSTPYRAYLQIFWSPDGSELYFQAFRTDDEYFEPAVARMIKINGEWQPPQLVVVNHLSVVGWGVRLAGLSPNGILAYAIEIHDGKNWTFFTGLLDPEDCVISSCDVLDGLPPEGIDRLGTAYIWTRSGSLLFKRLSYLREYSDAYLGIQTELLFDPSRGTVDSSL